MKTINLSIQMKGPILQSLCKMLFAMFLCSTFFIHVQARELSVKDFKHIPMDLSASTKMRTDNNGNPCALIKVALPIEDCDFEGNIVGSVTYKTNEYLVYVSSGTKSLLIKAPDNEPLMVNFNDYKIHAVEGKNTYQLKLDGEFGVTSSTQMQRLTIKYVPKAGTIFINGAQISGQDDNGKVSIVLPVGSYKYLFIWDDKSSIEGTVRLFASAAKELSLTTSGEVESNSQLSITDEQRMYEQAIDAIKIGEDRKAEEIAELGLTKGFEIFNEIFAALYYAGYYDDDKEDKVARILNRIKNYDAGRLELSAYRNKYKN